MMTRCLVLLTVAFAATAHAQLRDGKFHVFERLSSCPATRDEWLVVADELPVGGLNQFALVTTGSACTLGCTFAEATADAAALKASPRFLSVCCADYATLRDRRTGTMSVARHNGAGQPVEQEIVKSQLCCETAAALAGVPMCGFGADASNQARPAGTRLGCFHDPNSPYDLDGYLERSRANTPARCIAICAQKGFAYAGVQWSESCLCGNSYGKFGTASNCNMPCTGDRTKICGGSSSNTVYTTGVGVPTRPPPPTASALQTPPTASAPQAPPAKTPPPTAAPAATPPTSARKGALDVFK